MATIDTRYYSGTDIIKIVSGDTLNATNSTITVVDSNDAAVDLSGYDSGKLVIKNELSDADAEALLTFDTAENSLVLQNGSFYLSMAANSVTISKGRYKFALKVKEGAEEITGVTGDVYVDPEPTE